MFTEKEIKATLLRQLAVEYNCTSADFDRTDTLVTPVADHPDRRKYTPEPPPFAMVTLGKNAVISALPCLHEGIDEIAAHLPGFWLFEHGYLVQFDALLQKIGYAVCQTSHMFLPRPVLLGKSAPFPVRWLEGEEFFPYYGQFPNALCDRFHPERPDLLAVCAMDGERIVGMAGCSADTPLLWQIGIDVVPEFRGRGIGGALVGLLRDEIFRRGAIPFYGTSLSNLHSWSIALNCGFFPMWTELFLKKLPRKSIFNKM